MTIPAATQATTPGTVLRIERASIHDGHGLRTVVFLKGCPLRCAWCSTPEGQNPRIETAGGATYGQIMTVAEVMAEVCRDEVLYFHSGGGVTLSGGEPLLQPDFAAGILEASRRLGINTTLETSLAAPYAALEKLLPHLDTLYADLKHPDSAKHRGYCGAGNEVILGNLQRLARETGGPRLVVRVPLVPGVNDSDEDLARMARFCAGVGVMSIELLPYHRLGVPTYAKLGRGYLLPEARVPAAGYLDDRRECVRRAAAGLRVI